MRRLIKTSASTGIDRAGRTVAKSVPPWQLKR